MAKRKKPTGAQRNKRTIMRKRKSPAHRQARKASATARGKANKRTITAVKTKPKRAKSPAEKTQPLKPKNSPVLETTIVDVIEEPIPGVITVTEFEETELRQQSEDRD